MPVALTKFGKLLHKKGDSDLRKAAVFLRTWYKELQALLDSQFEGAVQTLFSSTFSPSTKRELVRYVTQTIDIYYDRMADYADELEAEAFLSTRSLLSKLMAKYLKIDVIDEKGAKVEEAVVTEAEEKSPIVLSFGTGDLNEDFQNYVKSRLKKGVDRPGVYIKSIAPDHIKVVQRAMQSALEQGADLAQGKEAVLRALRGKLDLDKIRKEMEYKIMRVMRTSYAQSANSVTYQFGNENKSMIKGFQRVADGRPCFICIMLDGKFYELNEPHDDHPNGMCRWVPVLATPAELGFEMKPKAEERLKKSMEIPPIKMTDKMAKELLSPQIYDALKAKGLNFEDLLVQKDGQWGLRNLSQLENVKSGKVKIRKDLSE